MLEKLKQIEAEAISAVNAAKSAEDIERLRIHYIGRKGQLTEILRSLGTVSPEDRPVVGQKANQLKNQIGNLLDSRSQEIKMQIESAKKDKLVLDITVPG